MKSILTTTTALSVALATVHPLPLVAQEVEGCVAGIGAGCGTDPAADAARRAADAAAEAAQRAAEEQAARAAAAAEAAQRAAAEEVARATAEAQAEAEAQVRAESQAQAEAQAAARKQAEEAASVAPAPVSEPVPEAPALTESAPEPPAGDQIPLSGEAVAEPVAPPAVAPSEPVPAPVEADAAQAPEAPPAVGTATEGRADTQDAPSEPGEATVGAAPEGRASEGQTSDGQPPVDRPDAGATAEAGPSGTDGAGPDGAGRGAAAPPVADEGAAVPVVAADDTPPPPGAAEMDSVTSILERPDAAEPAPVAAAAQVAAPSAPGQRAPQPLDAPTAPDAVVTSRTVTEADIRSSSEDFERRPPAGGPDAQPGNRPDAGGRKRERLSDFEKFGLVALGALAVGAILSDGKEVVDNTGDRVVVKGDDGRYYVYKDDDTVLRRPGSNIRTEQFRDGSTRTIVERTDGTQVVTIRDAAGRVLRRTAYDGMGRETLLIDDLEREQPVLPGSLPRPDPGRLTISTADDGATLRARMAAIAADDIGRRFSLRQIREIPQVRALAATIDVASITFDSGSPAIRAVEAEKLADLGRFIKALLRDDPGEIFLIEGHTDAVGSAASNLALSDRRAESVALALSEYFDVPPENLVVQGYGESELRIDTQGDERRNRRVVVRVITPLLQRGAR